MRLIIDAQALQTSGVRRGIGRYVRGLLRALLRARPGWVFEAVINSALPAPDDEELLSRMQVARFTPPLPMSAGTRALNELYFGDWLAQRGGGAVLELSFFDEESLAPQFVRPRPPLAAIAFDLVPVLFHEQYLASPPAHAIYKRRFRQFAQADLFLAISETTRHDLRRLMDVDGDRVVTIGGAAEGWAARPLGIPPVDRARRLAAMHIDGPFLLYVGGPDPRKNLRGTLEAFSLLPGPLRDSCRLVIVCELTARQEMALRSQARALGIEASMRLTSYVSDDTLRLLYEECRVSIFPSFYEGLGLPVLEALSCGAPVVASDRSSIPEFAGGAVVLVDPSSPRAICEGIEGALAVPREHGEEERRVAARQHTWDAVAGRTVGALEALGGGAGPRSSRGPDARPRAERTRIAWVLGADPSGARAGCLSELLSMLAAVFEVEVVAPPGAAVSTDVAPGLRILSPQSVWTRALERPFDLFVYQVEASVEPFLVEMLHWHSGLVVLHDWSAVTRRPVLAGGNALAVHDPHGWQRLRETGCSPVFHLGSLEEAESPERMLEVAGAYVAAIRLTIAARQAHDGEWRDAAASAVAEVRAGDSLASGMLDEWAQLRCEGREAVRVSPDATGVR
jgi:glycosyltransferase involved in cell wall biosynthesis